MKHRITPHQGLESYRKLLRRKLPAHFFEVEWDRVDAFLGGREDVTLSGIRRECARCSAWVYTSRAYPADVAVICEVCVTDLPEEGNGR